MVHPSKSPLKIFEKKDRGRIQALRTQFLGIPLIISRTWVYPETPQFWGVPPIISGTGKATDFKFGRYVDRVYVNKSPLKTPGTVAIQCMRSQGILHFFRSPIHWAHRAVIFATARFSCTSYSTHNRSFRRHESFQAITCTGTDNTKTQRINTHTRKYKNSWSLNKSTIKQWWSPGRGVSYHRRQVRRAWTAVGTCCGTPLVNRVLCL